MIPEHKNEMINSIVQDLDNVAIHSFHYHATSLDGQPQTQWRASNVYAKRKDKWKLVHSHWSMNKK